MSDEQLAGIIASGDNSKFSIPMSVGSPRAELDKSMYGMAWYGLAQVLWQTRFSEDFGSPRLEIKCIFFCAYYSYIHTKAVKAAPCMTQS